jgi:uncharacterized protein YbjT (DUF2867 family)
MRIVIGGATGHVGGRAVQELVAKKADVTVFVRNPAKLPEAVRSGVRVETGEMEDAAALTRAFAGADAALVILPPNTTTEQWPEWLHLIAQNYVQAIKAGGVKRVIMLSSFGAQRHGMGPITWLGEIEPMIQAAAPATVILRAGYFMENLLQFVPTLREQSVMYNPIAPTVKLPMVATRDIGDVAARRLLDQTWSGHRTVGVHGPADLSMTDAATILGRVLGRQVTYAQVPVQAAVDAMKQHGLSNAVATGYGEMLHGLSHPSVSAEERTIETTTPTTLEEFAREVIRPAVLAPAAAGA